MNRVRTDADSNCFLFLLLPMLLVKRLIKSTMLRFLAETFLVSLSCLKQLPAMERVDSLNAKVLMDYVESAILP